MNAMEGKVRSLTVEAILSSDVRASSVVAALAIAPTGQILAANDCVLRLLGRRVEQCVGTQIQSLLAEPAEWKPWARVMLGPTSKTHAELRLKSSDGRIVHLRGDIRRITAGKNRIWVTGLFVDASATKHLETSIHHASRMEAVASLTSGIAHDFSNLLTVLVGNLYLVSEGVRDQPRLYEKTKITRDAAKRGIELIRQLLSFARNERAASDTVDPRKLIGALEPLLKRSIGSRIALSVDVPPDALVVAANSAQLESAIVNLVVNAKDAIEDSGAIRIAVRNIALNFERAENYGVDQGEYVEISVSDTGSGIPPSLMGRVFEPFYSTKGEGKGTGLGLAMVRLFATHARGTALISSELGEGTTVTLVLPAAPDQVNVTQTTRTMPLRALPTGSETILVFAEDAELRGTIDQMLSLLGYRVFVGSDSEAEVGRIRNGGVHLVLADAKHFPTSAAYRLLRAISKLPRRLPTVVLHDAVQVHYADVLTLQKPFDLACLANTIRLALDGVKREQQ